MHVVSVTKSVASALIGIAIDEKIISGLDAALPELFPRYGKYLTADEKSMYPRGWTLRQIGAELGVPWKSVGQYLKGAGFVGVPCRRLITPEGITSIG